MMKRVLLIVLALFLTTGLAGICLGSIFPPPKDKSVKNIETSYTNGASELVKRNVGNAKILFDERLKHYRSTLSDFRTIQIGMLTLVIISLLIIIFRPEKIEVPLISISIPSGIVYLIIYFGGIYLWANFGLTFDTLVNHRLSLHHLAIALDINLGNGADYAYSFRHVLIDNSLIDNWFSVYFNIFSEASNGKTTDLLFRALGWIGLVGVYALLFGLYICCVVTSTVEFFEEKRIHKGVFYTMLIFLVFFFYVSTGALYMKMPYSTIWISIIFLFASIGIGTWLFKRNDFIRRNRENTLAMLP